MKAHQINELDNFIAAWTFEDPSICDEIIEFHKNNEFKGVGKAGGRIDKTIKDSTDCLLDDPLLLFNYEMNYLQPVVEKYKEKYPWCNQNTIWRPENFPNIQHYKPGSAYHGWHSERTTSKFPNRNRHLVFITYLNDVTDGGETEFYHQKLKIKPEKGLTLIWPTDWTYTHRGVPSPTQEKYIVTGWYSFVEDPEVAK